MDTGIAGGIQEEHQTSVEEKDYTNQANTVSTEIDASKKDVVDNMTRKGCSKNEED